MKNYKFYTIIVALFATYLVSAQNVQGTAFYTSKTNNEIDFSSRQGMPENVKKMIQERLKEMSSKTYILKFNTSTSIYQEEIVLKGTSLNPFADRMNMMMGAQDAGILYKNINKKEYTNQKDIYGKVFLIEDTLPTFNWGVENDTKQIGNYLCFKASTIIKMPKTRGGFPGNRPEEGQENENIKDQFEDVKVVVWYTLDIPVQQGPVKFWGLPGLILAVEMGNTKILCTKLELKNSNETLHISAPKKGKKITQEKFDKTFAKKMKELGETRGGGRPGGGFRGENRN